jgi:nondiscriminating glutamyl-tRNA synthetase
LTSLAEIGSHIDIFFDDKYKLTAEAKEILEKDTAGKVVRAFPEFLETDTGSPADIYASAIKYTREKTGAKGKELFMPIRAAITGKVHGPELDKVWVRMLLYEDLNLLYVDIIYLASSLLTELCG